MCKAYVTPFVVFAFYGALHELNFYENEHDMKILLSPQLRAKITLALRVACGGVPLMLDALQPR